MPRSRQAFHRLKPGLQYVVHRPDQVFRAGYRGPGRHFTGSSRDSRRHIRTIFDQRTPINNAAPIMGRCCLADHGVHTAARPYQTGKLLTHLRQIILERPQCHRITGNLPDLIGAGITVGMPQ